MNDKNIIYLETDFSIGDLICPVTEKEYHLFVNGFVIEQVQNNKATFYHILCSGAEGKRTEYQPYEIKKVAVNI
jgi:hypothetical protein